jgi:hypothetical protein
LKEIIRFRRGNPRLDLEKLDAQRQKQNSEIECERRNVERQWNNIQKSMSDTVSDLVWKINRKTIIQNYTGNDEYKK